MARAVWAVALSVGIGSCAGLAQAAPQTAEDIAIRDRVAAAYQRVASETKPGEDDQILDPTVIYGADDRMEYWQLATPQLRALADAACVLTNTSSVSFNAVAQTYSLATTPWTSAGGTLCPDEPFRGQPVGGFCSGFLVAPNIIATAGHCISAGQTGAFVFGFEIATQGGTTPAVYPANRVYFAQQVLAREQVGTGADYSVVRVDRSVTGITPVSIRRSGQVPVGTPLIMIGHPAGLPKKIDDGGTVRLNTPSAQFFEANVDAYGGNSGSMVVNANTFEVEGILVRGNADYVTVGGCRRSNVLPDNNGNWEDCTKTTAFASAVPLPGLNVAAGGVSEHGGPVGGPFNPASTAYTLTNTSATPVNWSVDISGVSQFITVNGASSGTLSGNASVTVTLAVSPAANSLSSGQYSGNVVFRDLTNSRNSTFTHSLDIGRRTYAWSGSVAIPDNGSGQTFINVPDSFQIADVNVQVNISHTFIGDLIVELTSPQNTVVRLHNRTGGSADNLVLTYDDEGTTPASPLSAFDGQNAQGNWRLFVSDNATVDVGTINSVTLRIQQVPLPPPSNPADLFPPPSGDGVRDINDILAFADAFDSENPIADLTGEGEFDINDILAFGDAFDLP